MSTATATPPATAPKPNPIASSPVQPLTPIATHPDVGRIVDYWQLTGERLKATPAMLIEKLPGDAGWNLMTFRVGGAGQALAEGRQNIRQVSKPQLGCWTWKQGEGPKEALRKSDDPNDKGKG